MADCELLDDVLENEEILSKVEIFHQYGCECSYGAKGSQFSQQFSKEAVLFNVNNCLELSHGELDLIILANVQASTNFETTSEKRKLEVHVVVSFTSTVPSARICFYISTALATRGFAD